MRDKSKNVDPVLEYRQQQLLATVPEEQRDFTALMFRIGNVTSHYYMEREAEPTPDDFDHWLEGLGELDADLAGKFRQEGFEKHRKALPLRRHAAERNGLGLDEYMKKYLTERDYVHWKMIVTE